MKLTTKTQLAALQKFAAKKDVRYYLNGIHCSADKMTASNGSALMTLPYADLPVEDFPEIDKQDTAPIEDMILDNDMIADAIKSASPHKHWPILDETILIRQHDKKAVSVSSHTSERAKTVSGAPIDGKYPNVEETMKSFHADGATFTVTTIDPEYLISLGQAIKGLGLKSCTLSIRSDKDATTDSEPLLFRAGPQDNPIASGVIMPRRA